MGRMRQGPAVVPAVVHEWAAEQHLPESPSDPLISAQAMRLHLLASEILRSAGSQSFIDREHAEHLATRCGALADELVEAGLWNEFDLCFQIIALAQ